MKKNKIFFIITTFLLFLTIEVNLIAASKNKIVARVENQIISSYELKNKIKIILFLTNQELNQENINFTKNKALKQLIDYKLKKNRILLAGLKTMNDMQVNHLGQFQIDG